MAPTLSEDEIDDLIYFARAGDLADLQESISTLAARESVSAAEILLAARDEGKSSPLHMAAGNGNLDIVTSLLSHFSSTQDQRKTFLDLPNEYGNTALHWASLRGHLPVVKVLMEAGANPAAANDKDQIPLDLALFEDRKDIVDHFMALSGGLEGENSQEGGLQQAVQDVEVSGEDDVGEEAQGKDGKGGDDAGRA
ncbi:hypothetical protein ACRALDRAFT_2028108 [Sodiomyces alcalophilus JCM 7366]|uniref:uncharacterized protein n=1 Tax=Sodiomyces alcalophilus JCM 7366 TaxID=591952 RepID=UPI0039B636EF